MSSRLKIVNTGIVIRDWLLGNRSRAALGRGGLLNFFRGHFSEEVLKRVGAGLLAEFDGGAIGDDVALVDDKGTGAGGIDFLEDVGGEEDGFGFSEAFDELADFVFLVGVEAVGGFIEDKYIGIM